MTLILAILIIFVVFLVGILLAISPGKPAPLIDAKGGVIPGSISEKVFVDINGVRQGMFITSKDATHPVLLYLHGGLPEFFLKSRYPTRLEDDFTVVWWEQRGSGISYSDSIPPESMNVEQMIADTIAVTNSLRSRFHQDKIYLMGHSGGSFIGILAAARAPELYAAYIGQAQMSNQLESEKLAYDYMLVRFKETGNTGIERKLASAPVTLEGGTPDAYLAVRDFAMHGLGIGTTHDMHSIVTGLLLPSFASRDYTLMEKINLWRGKSRAGVSVVWKDMTATDLSTQVTELKIPVYFLHGVYDYTCSYPLAKSFFEKLEAPVKGFYTFDHSAHSPMYEEPEKVESILREDVLAGVNTHADAE
jgi:pimeloyl-ACP methyl ester carboxylesterase